GFQILESISSAAHIISEQQVSRICAMALETETPFPSTNPFASRALSAFELLLGAFIVIGHNVFHIVPNEVIVLFLLGLVSIWLRDGKLSSMGFKRPASWRRIFLIALGAAGHRIFLGMLFTQGI